jgi:hypothetical protein
LIAQLCKSELNFLIFKGNSSARWLEKAENVEQDAAEGNYVSGWGEKQQKVNFFLISGDGDFEDDSGQFGGDFGSGQQRTASEDIGGTSGEWDLGGKSSLLL